MANTFIKPTQVVEAAALLLQREIVLPALFFKQADSSFKYVLNDTVTLRVPAVMSARRRTLRSTNPLVADELTETSVAVQLTDHIYKLLNVTDENLTLDIRDFASQVLQPQMRSVAEELELLIGETLAAANVSGQQYITFSDPDTSYDKIVDAGAILSHLKVGMSGRFIVAGTNIAAAFRKDDKLSKVNESGSDSALRDATIGRVSGFRIVESLALNPNDAYACHPTALALALVAPALPAGAAEKSYVNTEGITLRYLRDYNPTNSTGPVDRTLVDVFAGAKSVEQAGSSPTGTINRRIVKIHYTGTGPISD